MCVLDEATSALDDAAEAAMYSLLGEDCIYIKNSFGLFQYNQKLVYSSYNICIYFRRPVNIKIP